MSRSMAWKLNAFIVCFLVRRTWSDASDSCLVSAVDLAKGDALVACLL